MPSHDAATPHDAEWLEYDDSTRPPSHLFKEVTMLTQHAIVLERSDEPRSDRNVLFRAPADEDGNLGQTKLSLDQDAYVEMGGPAVVTVTVQPGDTLNADA